MRAFVRSLPLAALLFAAETSAQVQGAFLPSPPIGPGGEDVVETASGARCRQSMNNNNAYLDVGLLASQTGRERGQYGLDRGEGDRGQALGYARVTVPLGHKPDRLDCTRLYELEIERMRREIELLKLAAE